MVQVSGHLKVQFPPAEEDSKCAPQPVVLGLVAECRLIESSPSILEISIPQSSFTSTINLNLSIVSVDTRWVGVEYIVCVCVCACVCVCVCVHVCVCVCVCVYVCVQQITFKS